jgi:CRISPR type III-B/RAMP module-associated protein Cmr5
MATLMLERKRAADAWLAVQEVVRLSKDKGEKASDFQGRYRSQVRGGPAMIQRNGLGQFLAFLASKGFKNGTELEAGDDLANGVLYQHLGCWLLQALHGQEEPDRKAVVPGNAQTDPLAFLLLPTCDLQQTMHATREVLAWMQWARRFAESQLSIVKKVRPEQAGGSPDAQ